MSNHADLVQLIKRLSGQSNILTIPRIYIDLTGDLASALFLSQCVYWSDKTQNPNGFYKSDKEWQKELGLGAFQVKQCKKAVEAWVTTTIKRANGAPTSHYKVNIDAISESVSSLLRQESKSDLEVSSQSDLEVSSQSLTETTQETTQQIDEKDGEENFKSVVSLYENNIGLCVPIMADEIRKAVKLYPAEWFQPAISEAVKHHAKNWSYIEAVLSNWKKYGFGQRNETRRYGGRPTDPPLSENGHGVVVNPDGSLYV